MSTVRAAGGFEAAPDSRRSGGLAAETITIAVVFALSVVLLLASRLISPALGSWSQALTVLTLASFLIVVAFGQGLVVLIGGLDLSIPALITLGGVLTTNWIGTDGGASAWYLVPAILAVCAAVGVMSGLGVTRLGVPPFIMTMAVAIIVASVALGYTSGTPRGGSPAVFVDLMKARFLGLPVVAWFVLLFVVAGWVLQSRTALGRRLYAVGANPAAARIAGVPVERVVVGAYAISAACGGLCGMMLVGYANGATLRMGDSYLLPSIAAVVIGGSSILGGSGSFLGTVGGAILLTTLGTVIAAIGIEQGWRTVIEGAIILVALLFLRQELFERLRRAGRR
jgi:ribose transport system permease protein